MKNLLIILITLFSLNCYSQIIKQSKPRAKVIIKQIKPRAKVMIKKDIPDKDVIEKKIKIEWTNNGEVNKQVIRYYKDCKDFYSSTSVDPEKVKCTDMIINGRSCEVTNGGLQNIGDCATVSCPDCKTCREFADITADLGGVLIRCWETSKGLEGEVEMLTLVKRLNKIDPDKIKKEGY
jgi:hypothetical protein